MRKYFFVFSFLVIVISGCASSQVNLATLPSSTNTPENITPTLEPAPLAPCNEQILSSTELINPIYENNKINQIQLSNLYTKRIDFSSDSAKIFLNTDKGIFIVNIKTGRTLCFIPDEKTSFTGVALSPDGSLFASVNRSGKITLRDSNTGEIAHELYNGLYQSEVIWNWIEFNGDGSLLVSSGYFQPVRVWDIASGQVIMETLGVHAAISQDGKLLAISGSGYMQIINIARKMVQVTKVDNSSKPFILYLLFSPNGNYLYTLNTYSEINVWDVKTGELVHALNSCADCTGWGWEVEYPRISLSKDGKRLLLADPSNITLWNTQTWEKIMSERSPSNHPIIDASISPDGKKIIINYQDSDLIRFLYLNQ